MHKDIFCSRQVTNQEVNTMIRRVLYHAIALCLMTAGLIAEDVTPAPPPATYRAGIVEFKPPPELNTTSETIVRNARLYGEYATRAAEMGVKILVFSEYGLVTFDHLENRTSVSGYLQDVPDPKVHKWNPCEEPDRFNNTKVLHELSCASRDNSMVIVANLLSREPCSHPEIEDDLAESNSSNHCPADGHYQFNTNVIFGQNGTLLARYHKSHLFTEENFADPAPEPVYTIVDLGFVRIGTIVCFDILFAKPFTELIEKHGVRNIAYPTAWVNALPFMTAPQAFSSIAYGLGINILGANYFNPTTGSMGSGIFSSDLGGLNGTWDLSTPGRLVIADVPVEPSNVTKNDESLSCDFPKNVQTDFHTEGPVGNSADLFDAAFHVNTSVQEGVAPRFIFTDQPSSAAVNKTHMIMYEPYTNFTSTILSGMQNNITEFCVGSVCCNVSYKFAYRDANETYRLIAKSGIVVAPGGYKLGMQVCGVVRCENDFDIENCGRVPDPTHTPDTTFEQLILTGSFQTKFLYPHVMSTKLGLITTHWWRFTKRECDDHDEDGIFTFSAGRLMFTTAIETPILEASIVARVYEWD